MAGWWVKRHRRCQSDWASIVLVHNSGFHLDFVDSDGHGLPTPLRRVLYRTFDLQPHPRHAERQAGGRALRATG